MRLICRIAVGLLVIAPAAAPGQRIEDSRVAAVNVQAMSAGDAGTRMAVLQAGPPEKLPSIPLMIVSGTFFGAAGLVAGGMAGLRLQPECHEDMCELGGLIIGGLIGESVSLPLGVNIAAYPNGAPLGRQIATSFGVTVGGLALAAVTGGVGALLIPPVQMWVAISQERKAARAKLRQR
jgi:hypothetical protein